MPIAAYAVGDSVLLALKVVNKADSGNVILEDQGGRQHRVSDAVIKASGLNMTAVGSIASDSLQVVASPPYGDTADPGDTGITLQTPA